MKLDEALTKLEETVRTPKEAKDFERKYKQFDAMAAKKFAIARKGIVEALALTEVALALETILEEIKSGDDAADDALDEARDRAVAQLEEDHDGPRDFGLDIFQDAIKQVRKIRKF